MRGGEERSGRVRSGSCPPEGWEAKPRWCWQPPLASARLKAFSVVSLVLGNLAAQEAGVWVNSISSSHSLAGRKAFDRGPRRRQVVILGLLQWKER